MVTIISKFFGKVVSFFLLFMATVLFVSCQTKPIEIVKITAYQDLDTVFYPKDSIRRDTLVTKLEQFLVRNYNNDSLGIAYIDSFVFAHTKDSLKVYPDWGVSFYNESDETNLKSIEKNRRILDRYSEDNDKILHYAWDKGKLYVKERYWNGKQIDPKPSEIIIEDISK